MKRVTVLCLLYLIGLFYNGVSDATGLSGERPLNDFMYFRKLKQHLLGQPLTIDEIKEFRNAVNKNMTQSYLEQKINEYFKKDEYVLRMRYRLMDLFDLRRRLTKVMSDPFTPEDSLTFLIDELFRENLSWDQLLLRKSYRFPVLSERIGLAQLIKTKSFIQEKRAMIPDFVFWSPYHSKGLWVANGKEVSFDMLSLIWIELNNYNQLLKRQQNLIGNEKTSILGEESAVTASITFPDDDPRFAGILTTARFVERYSTTDVNKNRGRAAFVFRVFLCDPMQPVIPPPKDPKASHFPVLFEEELPEIKDHKTFHASADQIIQETQESKHGTDHRCMSCHYKLDPMGQVFQSMGVLAPIRAFPGRLTFKNMDGQLVDIPVTGLGGLAEQIVKQKDYVACQVSHLWKQFIGRDYPLTPDRHEELISIFNKLGRRPNDFIRYLVQSQEFRYPPPQPKTAVMHGQEEGTDEVITFSKVKFLLQRCDSCHGVMPHIPSFASWDSQTLRHQTEWLLKMQDRVNSTDPARRMPMDANNWNPNDLMMIRTWLSQGAPDDQGQPTIPSVNQKQKQAQQLKRQPQGDWSNAHLKHQNHLKKVVSQKSPQSLQQKAGYISFLHGLGKLKNLMHVSYLQGEQGYRFIKSDFKENWERYPSFDELIALIRHFFPSSYRLCFPNFKTTNDFNDHFSPFLEMSNESLLELMFESLGGKKPGEAKPAYENPGIPFVNWYVSCIYKIILDEKLQFFLWLEQLITNGPSVNLEARPLFLPPNSSFLTQYGIRLPLNTGEEFRFPSSSHLTLPNSSFMHRSVLWSDLSVVTKRKILAELVEFYLGVDEMIPHLKIVLINPPTGIAIDSDNKKIRNRWAQNQDDLVQDLLITIERINAVPDKEVLKLLSYSDDLVHKPFQMSWVTAVEVAKLMILLRYPFQY
ncbi:MAG: DUF1588 domain-containing protein [Bdellovibrionaceae bacterium]|nr:DUF1588 domain-containing protein [Pseudobdellovibrionaceae bacterium]